jgi:DNA-binding response OmpR family regulator
MNKPFALIVEDDQQLSQIFAKTLEANFETEIVGDGKDAIARMAEVEPVLVVLDLNLPGAGGKDILSSIRADTRLDNTRVILCTADERQADALQEQADIVMLKPVSPSQLREIAARFIPK